MIKHIAGGALLVLAAGSSAQAGTVQISPNVDYGQLSSVGLSFDGGAHYERALSGQLRLTRTGGTDRSLKMNTSFYAFCVEPTEWLKASMLTVGALATGDTAMGGMGKAKADAIARMFAHVMPHLGGRVSNDVGAAIQVSIWEIVRETSGHYSLDDGAFRVSTSAAIATLANQYLDYANGHGPQLYNLRAMTAVGAQDQLGQVPEPAALGVLGLGIAGVIAARRRRG